MKPRLFLRLVQPARALPFVLLLSVCALIQAQALFHLAWPREALFVTGAITLPLLAGAALTGLLHAVLHRPHALLLPDLLPKLRRAAAAAYLALAAVITLACKVAEPDAPAVAIFGLALGLLTLSCANRRLGFPRLKWLGLLSGSLTVALAWLVFHLRFAHDLLPALQTAPWAFLVGGVAVAATTFSLGFSRRTLRQRATTPYFAAGYNWTAFLDQSALRRQLKEHEQFNASRGLGPKPRTSRDWPLRTVGPRVRDWLRVLDHQHSLTPARLLILISVMTTGGILAGLAMTASFEAKGAPLLATVLSGLADLTGDAEHLSRLARTITTQVGTFLFMPLLYSATPSRPALAYPLARHRIAQTVFAHLCRNQAMTVLTSLLAIWLGSLVGQIVTSHFNTGLGLPVVAVYALAAAPCLPLFALTNFVGATRRAHIAAAAPAFIAISLFLLFARHNWSAFVLSPAGIALSLLATLGTLALLRWRIQRHYRTCDLTHEAAWATPFGAAGASGR